MKLTKELKERIDNYFDSISPEELYEISIKKYGFIDAGFEYEFENLNFQTRPVNTYKYTGCAKITFNTETDSSDLNKAA